MAGSKCTQSDANSNNKCRQKIARMDSHSVTPDDESKQKKKSANKVD